MNNHIGTNLNGTKALPNFDGVDINGASGNMILSNTISGNRGDASRVSAGIYIFNVATDNQVQGNKIGTGDDPINVSLPNQVGVAIADSSDNSIGGTTAGSANIISGNLQSGVIIFTNGTNNSATGNVLTVNTIRDNHQNGVYILNASGNQVGLPMAGNSIIHNGFPLSGSNLGPFSGVEIEGAAATRNVVQSNQIQDSANDGVYLFNASNNTIGGTLGVSGNNIMNSGASGVDIDGANATQNQVLGNMITGSKRFGVLIRRTRLGTWSGAATCSWAISLGNFQTGGNTFANNQTGPQGSQSQAIRVKVGGTSHRHPAGLRSLLSNRNRHHSKHVLGTR